MGTPSYILTKEHTINSNNQVLKLPAGSFVQPISHRYLPSHIKESITPYQNTDQGVYCYTRLGIIWIPKDIIRVT